VGCGPSGASAVAPESLVAYDDMETECKMPASPSGVRRLTAELRRELAGLELVQMPLNGEVGPLGQRNYGSLGALLSHALSSYAEHAELAHAESMRATLEQRDLYARISLTQKLTPQQRADLLAWAEAHSVLSFITRDGLLERFASHAPASWRALCALGAAAAHAGCADESPYALIADGTKLRSLLSDAAPAASKLMRLLPWCANPLAAASATKSGTRLRTAESSSAAGEAERLRVVRVRHRGRVWEKVLDWDEIAIVREPSPGRERGLLLAGGCPRFGRTNLRDW